MEAGAFDDCDFQKWESRMKQQDTDDRLADLERRRVEGKLSREEALLAKQHLTNDNRRKVKEIKEEVRTGAR